MSQVFFKEEKNKFKSSPQELKEKPIHRDQTVKLLLLLIATKIFAFIYLFNIEYIAPYGRLQLNEWWLIFYRWDSAFYDRIATLGYIDLKHWAFLPGFPAVIKAIYLLIGHSGVSTALAGLICGLTWIPVYYKVASAYMEDEAAIYSTLLFTFFPTVYVFTSIGYSEGLWLTSTLLGWYFYIKDKHLLSSLALTVSTLTRIPGFILPTLIILRELLHYRVKRACLYLLPLIALGMWFYYGFLSTGEPIAPLAAQQKTVWNPHLNFLELFMIGVIGGRPTASWNESSVFIVISLALFLYLYLKAFNVDKLLGIYSVCLFAVYLTTGYFLSMSRFLPFTFPIWMGVRVKKKSVIIPYILFNYLLALLLWSEFLNDRWIG